MNKNEKLNKSMLPKIEKVFFGKTERDFLKLNTYNNC